jgi:hypothetical protein
VLSILKITLHLLILFENGVFGTRLLAEFLKKLFFADLLTASAQHKLM